MPDRARIVSNTLGLAGAAAGGLAGYFLFSWLLGHGFYAMIVPGGLVGLGCSLMARHPSTPRGLACALGALLLSLTIEWAFFPFVTDDSFGYMLMHLPRKGSVTLLMIGAGVLVAFWMGKDAGSSGTFGGRKATASRRD